MRILLANLKHLYQRRALWLAYALLAFSIWINVIVWVGEPVALKGRFIGLIVLAFLVGMSAAMIHMEVLTKPFAFCLPGHRQAVKSFIFTVGVVANSASPMVFLFYPGLFPTERLVVLCSAFFAGWIFYSAGVWLTFRAKQPIIFVGLLIFAIVGGSLYTSFAIPISRSSNALVLALFIAVFLGYAGPRMWVMMAFVPLILVQTYASHPTLHSTMLTAGGRAERFASTLAVAVVAAGLLVLLIGIIAVMSVLLAAVMPDIAFRGVRLAYRAVGLEAFYAPLVLLPLAGAIQLILYRRPVLMIVMLLTLIYLAMIVGITFGKELMAIANPGTAIALAVASWLILVLVLRHISMKRSLVK